MNRTFLVITTADNSLDTIPTLFVLIRFEMYHFSEVIVDGRYGFDYLLKKGPCKTRNAIKLLELTGYPKVITETAHNIGNRISHNPGHAAHASS